MSSEAQGPSLRDVAARWIAALEQYGQRSHLRWSAAGTLMLMIVLAWVHRWYASPFPVWVGWDEAYIAAFAGRLLDGRGLPYVDAVSHRGPVLYWIAALALVLQPRFDWGTMRNAALLFAELNVLFAFALGVVARHPLAGFVGALTFVFATLFGMSPIDGVGFNGEIVATPLVLLSIVMAFVALEYLKPDDERRVWLATVSGLVGMAAALTKQIAFSHLVTLALLWAAAAWREQSPKAPRSFRTLTAFVLGLATPLVALVALYGRSGQLRALHYYFYTYNREVYFGPVTLGYAIESGYLFLRAHAFGALMTVLFVGWAGAYIAKAIRDRSARGLLNGATTELFVGACALNLLLAIVGAAGTFRFFDHYFITTLPWCGLLIGTLIEQQVSSTSRWHAGALLVAPTVVIALVLGFTTRLWLDGERRRGAYLNPAQDPVTRYILDHTSPDDRVFVWGFAPEYYTSAARRPASRFVYTSPVAGIVPWFENLTLEQENKFAVPGSRALLIRELQATRPPLILDVPLSMKGRGMRRYAELRNYLDAHYCFERTLHGGADRLVHVYVRKTGSEACTRNAPELPALPLKRKDKE